LKDGTDRLTGGSFKHRDKDAKMRITRLKSLQDPGTVEFDSWVLPQIGYIIFILYWNGFALMRYACFYVLVGPGGQAAFGWKQHASEHASVGGAKRKDGDGVVCHPVWDDQTIQSIYVQSRTRT